MSNPSKKSQKQPARALPVNANVVLAVVVAALGLLLTTQTQNPIGDALRSLDSLLPTPFQARHAEALDRTNHITYRGSVKGPVEHFQNVFYAHDTSGQNRFAPPKPYLAPAGSIVDATAPGAWCSQGLGPTFPFASTVTNVSENCLSLWIARPRATKQTAKLPVVVYLHGGMWPWNQ